MSEEEYSNYTDLIYDKFKEYEVEPESIGFIKLVGINHKFIFNNGYGASVIKTLRKLWK